MSATTAPGTGASGEHDDEGTEVKTDPVSNWADERLGIYKGTKSLIRKVFPDHWSFLLGEIALFSFILILLSGVFLTLWFNPSMGEVEYHGSYIPLQGVSMSEAFASTLHISFDVRAGLLMRQVHHWAALIFLMAIMVHMLRIFFTGAFRKPREINWLIGFTLMVLGLLEGFAGYSLPDDLLSGTGLRIASGVILSIPIVGTYVSYFLFGGDFPGHDFIPRLFTIHVLLIPALIVGLVTAHLILVFVQKHTQWAGPGKTNENVVGLPLLPVYTAKAGGFMFVIFGVIFLLAGLVQINPIWAYGPYTPDQISAGSQPDWYIGFLEGSLRMMPNWEWNLWGHTLSFNVLIPSLIVPGVLFTALAVWPFLEQWITGDKREHHLLDRPRNRPTRTALGVGGITFYGVLWLGGGNDLIATHFHLSVEALTWTFRVLIFLGPVIAFWCTKRIALGLQRRDKDKVLHGRETGIIKVSLEGEFTEVHEPLSAGERYRLTAHEVQKPLELGPATDENGVERPGNRALKLRAKASKAMFSDHVETTVEEYKEIEAGHGHH